MKKKTIEQVLEEVAYFNLQNERDKILSKYRTKFIALRAKMYTLRAKYQEEYKSMLNELNNLKYENLEAIQKNMESIRNKF